MSKLELEHGQIHKNVKFQRILPKQGYLPRFGQLFANMLTCVDLYINLAVFYSKKPTFLEIFCKNSHWEAEITKKIDFSIRILLEIST